MPNATITSTASTFGTISGVFSADQSTVIGTVSGPVVGTLDGSVGVPGPQGPAGAAGATGPQGIPGQQGDPGVGVPAGGTTGQVLAKVDAVDYNTEWVDQSADFISSVTAPLSVSGGDLSIDLSAYATTSSLSAYLTKSGNLAGLTNLATARDNLNLGALNSPTFAGLTVQGSGANAANLGPTALTLAHTGYGSFVIQPSGGITFPNGTTQTTAYPGPVGATTWGSITGTLSNQTDLQTALDGKYSTTNPAGYITSSALSGYLLSSTAASTYYLQTNPSGYQTAANVSTALTGYATETFVTGQGYITSSALSGYATEAWVYSQDYLVPSSLTGYATESWVTSQGYLTSAPVTSVAGRTGAITLSNTDISGLGTMATASAANYSTTSVANGLYYPLSANPSAYLVASALTPYAPLAGATFTGKVNTVLASTTAAGLNVPHGAAPTSPVNGDIWSTTSGLFARINNSTKQFGALGDTNTFTGTNTFSGATVSFGTSTAASTINVGTGATLTATTKAVNIGTAGVAGSTTNIAVGSTTGTSTTTLQGNTSGVTLAQNTNTTGLATTAFVLAQASAITPVVDGTATIGSATTFARADHVHPTDTSRAPLASPTFTGDPQAPTPATGDNDTSIATTAFVKAQGYLTTNAVTSVAGRTGAITLAVADVSGAAPLASPSLTGTPLSVTAAVSTNTTQIATTAFVVGQVGTATPLINGTAAVGTSLLYARQDHVHPTDTTRAALASPTFTGTPSLPTGTTAITQTAGDNTTALATTAFVMAAVPAVASLTEARQFTNTTKAMSPLDVLWSMQSQDCMDIIRSGFAYTTTGTPQFNEIGYVSTRSRLNATGASSVMCRPFGTSQVDQVVPYLFRENPSSAILFNLKTYISGRAGNSIVLSDATLNQAVWFGKLENDPNGDLIRRGFGWAWSGGAGSRFVNLVVHNGTTLTTVPSSYAVTQNIGFDWDLYSDGTGNVTLYINGVSRATSSAGPTSYQSAGAYGWYREEFYTTGAPSFGNHTSIFTRGRIAIINY